MLDLPHRYSTPHPHAPQSNYLPTKGVLSQDMLLAAGILNNGFTDCARVGKAGDGIMGIYSASYTTNNKKERSTQDMGEIFFVE